MADDSTRSCEWCGRTYDFYKSSASSRLYYCGKKCELEKKAEQDADWNRKLEGSGLSSGSTTRSQSSSHESLSDDSMIAFAESQKAQAETQQMAIGAKMIEDDRKAELNREKRIQRRKTVSTLHIPGFFKDLYVDKPGLFFLLMLAGNVWIIAPLALMHFNRAGDEDASPIPEAADELKSDFLRTKQEHDGLSMLASPLQGTGKLARMKAILEVYRLNHGSHDEFQALESYFSTTIKELEERREKVLMAFGVAGLITLYVTLDKFGIF